jgi:hypothetical protein
VTDDVPRNHLGLRMPQRPPGPPGKLSPPPRPPEQPRPPATPPLSQRERLQRAHGRQVAWREQATTSTRALRDIDGGKLGVFWKSDAEATDSISWQRAFDLQEFLDERIRPGLHSDGLLGHALVRQVEPLRGRRSVLDGAGEGMTEHQ